MNVDRFFLKSAGVSRVLLWLLRLALVVDGVSAILTLLAISLPASLPISTAWQNLLRFPLVAILLICLYLAILLLSLVWIYRLHKDLRQCYPSYPIDAWDALWSFIFIIFIWKTLMTIARHFKAEAGRLRAYGRRLYRLIPMMYGIFITSYLLDQLIYRYDDYLGSVKSVRNIPDSLLFVALIGNKFLGVLGIILLLMIAQTIANAMQLKVRQIKNANKSAEVE